MRLAGPCGPCEVQSPLDDSCVGPPPAGCIRPTVPNRAKLQLRNSPLNVPQDKLAWTLKRINTTTPADFGNPTIDGPLVACLFSGDPANPEPLAQLGIPAADTCGSRPCWKSTATGFKRSATATAASGVRSVLLRAGGANRAQIMLKSESARLR